MLLSVVLCLDQWTLPSKTPNPRVRSVQTLHPPKHDSSTSKMGFVSDFIATRMMESPRDRDVAFDEYVKKTKVGAEITKETWAQPTRTWGFWNSDKFNMVYHFKLDPAYSKAPGRSDAYDEQLRSTK